MNTPDPATKNRKDLVSIYQVNLSNICKKHIKSFYRLLSTEEKSRAQGFVKKQDRDNFAITYGILRVILNHHSHLPPKEICIHRNTYGKPYVDCPGVHFNLSHAKNLLVIAVTNHEVGVDVEYLNPTFDFQQVIELVLCEAEQQKLRRVWPDKQVAQFFAYWTAKEALLKFLGTGFSLDPTTLKLRHNSSGCLQSLRFPQIVLQPLEIMDSNFVGYLAYASQCSYITYEDISKLLSQPM